MFELFDYLNFNKKEYMCGVPLMKIIYAHFLFLEIFCSSFRIHIKFPQCRWRKLKPWHGHNMWISASSMERGLGLSQILLSVGGWTLSYIDFFNICYTTLFKICVSKTFTNSVKVNYNWIVRTISRGQWGDFGLRGGRREANASGWIWMIMIMAMMMVVIIIAIISIV